MSITCNSSQSATVRGREKEFFFKKNETEEEEET
jgi:hypothetical protein